MYQITVVLRNYRKIVGERRWPTILEWKKYKLSDMFWSEIRKEIKMSGTGYSCADETISEKRLAAEKAQRELYEAISKCDHDFSLISQRHTILGQTMLSQGWQGYVQELVCKKCGTKSKSRSVLPICIDCKTELVRADKQDIKENRTEFMDAFETSLCSGAGLSSEGVGYRCLECKRVHVYVISGD